MFIWKVKLGMNTRPVKDDSNKFQNYPLDTGITRWNGFTIYSTERKAYEALIQHEQEAIDEYRRLGSKREERMERIIKYMNESKVK